MMHEPVYYISNNNYQKDTKTNKIDDFMKNQKKFRLD